MNTAKFLPDVWLSSIDEISAEQLWQQGIRGLISDLDNTLVPHGAPPDARAEQFLNSLRQRGIKVYFASNNKRERVRQFAHLGDGWMSRSAKPLRFAYKRAMRHMGTTKATTAMLGDQLFSDIWGGKRCGLYCILVTPIEKSEKEGRFVAFKRRMEERVLKDYVH